MQLVGRSNMNGPPVAHLNDWSSHNTEKLFKRLYAHLFSIKAILSNADTKSDR